MSEAARIRIDESDPTPTFEQIRRQIVGHIVSGALPVGSRLPPLRQLARDLGIAVNTAAHAYRLLDEAGLIVTRRGAGTRVAAVPPPAESGELPAELAAAGAAYFTAAASLGMTPNEAAEALVVEARRRSTHP